MAVRYLLLSLAAVLTCLTLNEAPACPTEHGLIAPATQAFSPRIEDESISTYIGELAASSSYDGSTAKLKMDVAPGRDPLYQWEGLDRC